MSPKEALSEEAKTLMLTTSVRPTISAAAVAAVRRGLRAAFCSASSAGRPRHRKGAASTGSATMTPVMTARSPTPKTIGSASP